MKNLFRRIYIKHDNNMITNENQQRFFISDRNFEHHFPSDRGIRERLKIMEVFQGLDKVDEHYGNRAGFWSYMRAADARVCIIGGRDVVAELLIQYWKSIFKQTTVQAMYELYTRFVNNENLLSLHAKTTIDSDNNTDALEIQAIPFERFEEISNRTAADWTISELNVRDIPIEYLLFSYFAQPNQRSAARKNAGQITFRKVRDIVLTNVVSQLVDARKDYFISTHNFYKLYPDDVQPVIGDTLAQIKANENLAWVLDPLFSVENINHVVGHYGLPKLKEFFDTYAKLFNYRYEEEFALEYLIKDDIFGLLEYDVLDENGNFFGTEDFVFKINGLMISYGYQLYRQGRKDELIKYDLRVS